MLSSLNTAQKGILSALLGYTSFALADACAKWLSAYYETVHVIFWVYCSALIFGIILSPFLGGLKNTLNTKKLLIHLGRGVCAFAIAMLVVTSLRELSLAMLYTILFLAPFLTTIAAIPIYKEPVPLKNWVIIAIGFSGIIVAFRPDITEITPAVIYAFSSLFFIVALGLLSRPLAKSETLLSLSFYPSISVLFLLGTALLPEAPLPQTQHIPVFLFNGLCVVVGLGGIAHGYRIAPFSIVAPIHYTQMVIALILGYLIFSDIPNLWMMAGASIIIVSGIMLAISSQKSK